MKEPAAQKHRRHRGFSLAETLIAMLLMSFVGLIVTGGISMGAQVYGRIVERSNAELLLSTTLLEMRDELDRTEEITLESYNNAYQAYSLDMYRSSNTNWRKLSCSANTGIEVTISNGYVGAAAGEAQRLVTREAAAKDLYAVFTGIAFTGTTENGKSITPTEFSTDAVNTVKNGTFRIYGLKVKNKSGTVLASTGSDYYTIRALESVRVYPESTFKEKEEE